MISAIWGAVLELAPFILMLGGLIAGAAVFYWWVVINEREDAREARRRAEFNRWR